MIPKLTSADIVALRPSVERPQVGKQPLGIVTETEPSDKFGRLVETATLFLVGPECQFRCVMCDLWMHTTENRDSANTIAEQIEAGISQLSTHSKVTWLKLYNASNFFSPANISVDQYDQMIRLLSGFDRVIVENHPTLTSKLVEDFSARIDAQLEIALGLETAHKESLARLNKSITLEDFAASCAWNADHDIETRAFVLLQTPGLSQTDSRSWCSRSIKFAEECGVRHVSVIPLRTGNGVIDQFLAQGLLRLPSVYDFEVILEHVAEYSIILTGDLWDWDQLQGQCSQCSSIRKERLNLANLRQRFEKLSQLPNCGCKMLD